MSEIERIKKATTDHAIHDPLRGRFSPYAYDGADVADSDLCSMFEAARWAPSSFNEQPWSYIVARRGHEGDFASLLSCLLDGNRAWARFAPVLALGVAKLRFTRNDKLNAAALHDLGQASAYLTFEATQRGLYVHQMIGILPDRARELYSIPDGYEAITGLAIGGLGDGQGLDENIVARDRTERTRKPLSEFVFGGGWGKSAGFV